MKKSPSPLEKAGWGIGILNQNSLILETVDWSRNTTGTVYECLATEWVYRHDWSMTEQTAKIYIVAYLHAHNWDDTYGSSLLVNHTDGSLVGNDTGNGGGRSIARDGNHIQTY